MATTPRSNGTFRNMRTCIANVTLTLALLLAWQISQRELWLTSTLTPSAEEVADKKPVANAQSETTNPRRDKHISPLETPRNLSIVFVGDSLMRYQYLSLAYFLRHGRWWDSPANAPNNLMNAHSFHHPAHPSEDWNEFLLQSNRMLYPLEACDCERSVNSSDIVLERRYFFDETNNNKLVYINLNGNETHGSWGFYGRFLPQDVFRDFDKMVKMPVAFDTDRHRRFAWEYSTWGDVIREHVGNLGLRSSTTILLNAGHHRNSFGGNSTNARKSRVDVVKSLKAINMQGTWKTTTFARSELQNSTSPPRVRPTDRRMCKLIGQCFNLSWTAKVKPELYFDELHLLEPVYRSLNEELLEKVGALDSSYTPIDRSTLLRA